MFKHTHTHTHTHTRTHVPAHTHGGGQTMPFTYVSFMVVTPVPGDLMPSLACKYPASTWCIYTQHIDIKSINLFKEENTTMLVSDGLQL